ncbi:hypothetical protein FJZ26_05775 [Candidatus Parvarchaeota archaeon]|nr:hypothetical protein [Candidatus Parvarchaeota archaeon]
MQPALAHSFPQIRNSIRAKKIISVGTPAENNLVGKNLLHIHPKPEFIPISTLTPKLGRQKSSRHTIEELSSALKGADSHTIIITDIGQNPRESRFEEIVQVAAEKSKGAQVYLLTSRDECIGNPFALDDFVLGRSFSPALLQNVKVFFYQGQEKVIQSIVRLHEDHLNHEKKPGESLLVVEDYPSHYTSFLNTLFDITHHRTRVLLARTFEEAEKIINECKDLLSGAILDIETPRGGHLVSDGWPLLVDKIKKYDERTPIVVQSAQQEWAQQAASEHRVFSIWKDDPIFLQELKRIINDYFGFGDFVFRTPDGKEVARAHSLLQVYGLIMTMNSESLRYHAERNDFSHWLWLHGHKELAHKFKPIHSEDTNELRSQLQELIEPYLQLKRK